MLTLLLVIFCGLSCVSCQGYSVIPIITEYPRDQVVAEGGAASFTCSYTTPSPLHTSLSWYREGARIPGASSSLVLPRVHVTDAGRYWCVVSSPIGSVQSRPARLTVTQVQTRPQISDRPVQTRVTRGHTIVLDCQASGYPPPTYAWYKDGGRLSSAHDRFTVATNGSLVITNAQIDDTAHYRSVS